MPVFDEEDLINRAFAAYYRSGGGGRPVQNHSGVEKHKRKAYVVLRNGAAQKIIAAVYRVRNDGMLKRLKRWPEILNRETGW